ncbi:MAG: ATP-binding protein [Verrucomicrobiota bacterium]
MKTGLNPRVVAFLLAIACMIGGTLWAGHVLSKRIQEIQTKLTLVELESFELADRIQDSLMRLNSVLARYGMSQEAADWTLFNNESQALDDWIQHQSANLHSQEERQLLAGISGAYSNYLASAAQFHENLPEAARTGARLKIYGEVELQSQQVLTRNLQLAMAGRESMSAFLTRSRNSLSQLRLALLSTICLLLLAGTGIAAILYREQITALRVKLVESQEQVERQEKLAALGLLAAGIAHEIRNPLTALKAWLFIQSKDLAPNTPEFEDAEIIKNELTRLERLVQDFLQFARPSEPHLESVPADRPLREVQALLAPALRKHGIQLQLADPLSTTPIQADPQQIRQVLINLVQNAADSIDHDGTITLRSRPANGRVVLEVEDTGAGIPPGVEDRLFDPFFTTKTSGTGLGLPIAARIVENHGGALQYQTQLGHGTTFGILLPQAPS